jgi:capsular polysaccharide biosynthesis protein
LENPELIQISQNQESSIDLKKILKLVLKHIKLVLILTLTGTLIALAVTVLFIKPKYSATVKLYVNNKEQQEQGTSVNTGDISASVSLVKTYIEMIKTQSLMDMVRDRGGYSLTNRQLLDMIKTGQLNNTQLFYVTVETPDPQLSASIANTIALSADEFIEEKVQGSSLEIIDYATVPKSKSSPSIPRNTLIGFAAGLVVSALLIFILAVTDTKINTEEDVKQVTLLPVIGTISNFDQASRGGYYGRYGYGSTSNTQNKETSSVQD